MICLIQYLYAEAHPKHRILPCSECPLLWKCNRVSENISSHEIDTLVKKNKALDERIKELEKKLKEAEKE